MQRTQKRAHDMHNLSIQPIPAHPLFRTHKASMRSKKRSHPPTHNTSAHTHTHTATSPFTDTLICTSNSHPVRISTQAAISQPEL